MIQFRNILIVEDDPNLRNMLFEHFSRENNVNSCDTVKRAIELVADTRYDIILLDVILKDGSGLSLFDYVEDTPVIIFSDLGSDSNMLDGFSCGAVDYIVKPASLQIIETRMNLRLLPQSRAKLSSHGLTVNCTKRTAEFRGKPLELTSSEFNILLFLMQNEGKFFTAVQIYENVWNLPHLNTTTIKTHLSNLRKKMLTASKDCSDLIVTEFGKGYAFFGDNV